MVGEQDARLGVTEDAVIEAGVVGVREVRVGVDDRRARETASGTVMVRDVRVGVDDFPDS